METGSHAEDIGKQLRSPGYDSDGSRIPRTNGTRYDFVRRHVFIYGAWHSTLLFV